MKASVIITLLVAVALLLVAAGCTSDAAPVKPEKTPVGNNMSWMGGLITASNVIDAYSGSGNSKTMSITGKMTNHWQDNTGRIVITADLYDANDVKVGYSTTTINDMRINESAMFKITFYDQDAINSYTRYRITLD